MTALSAGSKLIWFLADYEAVAGKFGETSPWHFLLGCFKLCDLDMAEFLRNSPLDVQADGAEISEDVERLRQHVCRKARDVTAVRRSLRRALGKGTRGEGNDSQHRTPAARAVFARAAERARERGDSSRPLDLFEALMEWFPQAGADGELAKFAEALLGAFAPRGADADGRKDAEGDKPAKKKAQKSALAAFGRDITALAKRGKLEPVIGRKDETKQVARILSQKRKSNPLLLGEPGVGKTGIVEGLAQRIAAGECPEFLREARIIEISMAALVAGTTLRGEFEARLLAVIQEAEESPEVILFIDEIHTLVGAGKGGGAMDAANILKPALARGSLKVIGATTTSEFRQHIEKDAALERRFQVVMVEEPSRDEAVEILRGLRARFEEHHAVEIGDDALAAAVDLAVRYLPDFRLPDKAIDLVDQACAMAMVRSLSAKGRAAARVNIIGKAEIAAAVAERCRIPVAQLPGDERERLLRIESVLEARVKGQPHAIAAVADAVRVARAGMKDATKPVAVFLFAGPTGTGKTELAKALAEFLFGAEASLLRFDMSEYMEEHSVSKLIGSPPGYIGHDEGGRLTDAVRAKPYSVVLFDEVEKAHPRVLDLFLQVFDEGTLTDSRGRKASFRETVIILTSNLGSSTAPVRKKMGFGGGSDDADDLQARVAEAVWRHLRPELLNRISRTVVFNPLTREHVRAVAEKFIARLNARLAEQGLTLTLDEPVYALLMERGYSPELGARPMERAIEALIAQPLAKAILTDGYRQGAEIAARVLGDAVVFAECE